MTPPANPSTPTAAQSGVAIADSPAGPLQYLGGFRPNPARSAVADHPFGPWKELGNPCTGKDAQLTFHSQSTFVLTVHSSKDVSIFMADRWKEWDLADSCYVWLPISFDASGKPVIGWRNEWKPGLQSPMSGCATP